MNVPRTAPPPIRRLGVLGDVHAEDERLEAVLDWFADQQLDAVLCTGDLADGVGCVDRCCELLRSAGVHTVAGNHDRWLLSDRVRHLPDAHRAGELAADSLTFLRDLPRTLDLDTVAGPLWLCHGIGDNDQAKVWPGTRGPDSIRRCGVLDSVLADQHYRFIIHGHLHHRVLIDFRHALLLNAGTLKGPRAGVSIIDFEAGDLRAFELEPTNTLRPGACHTISPGSERRVWRDTADFDGAWMPVLV
jgi:predicted phosphodiesterase